MLKSFLNKARAAARSRLSLLTLLGLATLSTVAWQGCGDNSIPSASNAPTAEPSSSIVVDGYDALPPEVQEKIDLVVGTLEDITSGERDRVDAGFARLDEIEPGLHDQVVSAFEYAITGSSDTFTIDLPLILSGRSELQDPPKYCVTIRIEGKVTVKAGSKFCYKRVCQGGITISHCDTLHEDTTFDIDKTFEFCIDGIEGCSVSHSSTSQTTVTVPIDYSDTKTEGNCTTTKTLNAVIEADLKITITVKTCK
ncbi:MAG: hypothetical protein IPK72_23875 [Candidatus Eisenbacteria bacterium]|nr:hypothetical protein [Candidatus Eisenbacteria bacterium]